MFENQVSPRGNPISSHKLSLITLLFGLVFPTFLAAYGPGQISMNVLHGNGGAPDECYAKESGNYVTECHYNVYGDLEIKRVFKDGDIEPVFGDFQWRYLQRGISEGARLSNLRYPLRSVLGYDDGNFVSRMLNPLNPTPFLIFIALSFASMIIFWIEKGQNV